MTCSEGFNKEVYYIKDIKYSDIDNFIDRLKVINYLNWKRKYVNSDILDETQWIIDIVTDKKKTHIYGSNDFLKDWGKFCSLIQDFVCRHFA